MSDPTAADPWTVTLAWTPDQNFRAVSVYEGRTPLHAIFGLFNAGEKTEAICADFGLAYEQVAVLYQLHLELIGGAT